MTLQWFRHWVSCAEIAEAQKKVVKRQALVERALARHLPARILAGKATEGSKGKDRFEDDGMLSKLFGFCL